MIEDGVGPDGMKKDWTEWIARQSKICADHPLSKMETTHRIDGLDLVYMPEDVFKAMYEKELMQ